MLNRLAQKIAGSSMSRLTVLLFCALAALCAAAPASADLTVGAADDGGRLATDGGAWFVDQFREVGLQENRVTIGGSVSSSTVTSRVPRRPG